jgi:hypothetical protein
MSLLPVFLSPPKVRELLEFVDELGLGLGALDAKTMGT